MTEPTIKIEVLNYEDLTEEDRVQQARIATVCHICECALSNEDANIVGPVLLRLTAEFFARHPPHSRAEVMEAHWKAFEQLVPLFHNHLAENGLIPKEWNHETN